MRRLIALLLILMLLWTAEAQIAPLITPQNITDLTVIAQLQGHEDVVSAVAFSEQWMATAGWDDTIRVWDQTTGEVVYTFLRSANQLHFNRDGTRLASLGNEGGGVWNLETGDLLWWDTLVNTDGAFASDDTLLVARAFDVNEDHYIRLYDAESGAVVRDLEVGFNFGVDNNYVVDLITREGLIETSTGGGLRTWDAETGEELTQFMSEDGEGFGQLEYSRSGDLLAIGMDDRVILVSDGEIVRELPQEPAPFDIAFNADDSLMATQHCIERDTQQRCVEVETRFWDLTQEGSEPLHAFSLSVDKDTLVNVFDMSFSPDGRLFALTHMQRSVLLYGVVAADACIISAPGAANLRSGAGTSFSARGTMNAGDTLPVFGRAMGNDGYTWWRLYGDTWVREDVVQEAGDCDSVQEIN